MLSYSSFSAVPLGSKFAKFQLGGQPPAKSGSRVTQATALNREKSDGKAAAASDSKVSASSKSGKSQSDLGASLKRKRVEELKDEREPSSSRETKPSTDKREDDQSTSGVATSKGISQLDQSEISDSMADTPMGSEVEPDEGERSIQNI